MQLVFWWVLGWFLGIAMIAKKERRVTAVDIFLTGFVWWLLLPGMLFNSLTGNPVIWEEDGE